jgi:hypothetical protein
MTGPCRRDARWSVRSGGSAAAGEMAGAGEVLIEYE